MSAVDGIVRDGAMTYVWVAFLLTWLTVGGYGLVLARRARAEAQEKR